MKIAELSDGTRTSEVIKKIQTALKEITKFFKYVNEENPTMAAIAEKFNFAKIKLRGKLKERDEGR